VLEALQREELKQLCPLNATLYSGREGNEEKGVGMAEEKGDIADIVVDGNYEPRRREQLATQRTDAAQLARLISRAETIRITFLSI